MGYEFCHALATKPGYRPSEWGGGGGRIWSDQRKNETNMTTLKSVKLEDKNEYVDQMGNFVP